MSKIKVAVIGVGNISGVHINGYLKNPDVELYAFCDINEQRLKEKGEKYGVTRLYTDKDVMLRELPELDAVSVCTWNAAHAECTIAALNAGKHVLCEKPMAMNAQQAEEMMEAARRNNKLLQIGFVRRFGNDCNILMDFVKNDTFGELYYAKASYLRRHGCPGGWFCNKELSGGGPLIDLGVHVIDLARYVAGRPHPVSAYGATFNKLGNRPEMKRKGGEYTASDKNSDVFNVEDFATGMIRFDNGFVMSIEASFDLNKPSHNNIELMGTKAGATLSPDIEIFSNVNDYPMNMKFGIDTALDFDGLFEREINHYVDCVLGRAECIAPAEDGVTLMRILDALYESARTGHEVLIQD